MIDFIIEQKQIELADAVNEYNAAHNINTRITPDAVCFDDSRSWSLYVPGCCMDLSCNKFGAWRGYLGGGVRGAMDHNGRDQEGTTDLGNLFAAALREIEAAYNEELTPDASESWEQATGVLL